MIFAVLDIESYFDSEYTFDKMSTEQYVRDPRFEAHGAAIKWSANTPAQWYDEKRLRWILKETDWSEIFLVSHHAQWDHFALNHHYDARPAMSGCTLSMARLMLGNHLSKSLEAVRKHYGIPPKTTPYNLFRGKHWHQLTPHEQQLVAEGACDEAESIWTIFGLLMRDGFPPEELTLVDLTIKMFSQPCLRADTELLATIWEKEEKAKAKRLADLKVDLAELNSANKFAALLRAEGIEPETKEGKKGPIYAFAKTDPFMESLLEDEDERVRGLAEARVGAKSTLLQTRAENWGFMASRGDLCVYLAYAAAHTSRWGGGDLSNFQNPPPALNKAIMAPEGFLLAAPDASQIECRLLNFIAGQEDKIEDFRQGRDPYVGVAEAFCGHRVTKETHPELRQAGKVVELQAGYGSGGEKIRRTLRIKAGILITPEEGELYKKAYRDTHPKVVELWKTGGRMISRLAGGEPTSWGPTEIRKQKLVLPNGIPLDYSTLEFYRPSADEEITNQYDRDGYWRLRSRKGWTKIYGSLLVENLIQALARVVVSQAMIRIARKGYRIVGMKHDDLWILIPRDGHENQHLQDCLDEMSVTPVWLPGLPLSAEGSLSERYSK